MRTVLPFTIALALIGTLQMRAAPLAPPDSGQTVAYVGGRVWNGAQFVDRSLFVRGGRFVGAQARADTTIDLDSRYVVPPFGDAHTHALGRGGISIPVADSLFLQHGVFYAADLTNPYSEIREIQDALETSATLDVVYANGGITATGMWPAQAFEPEGTPDSTWTAAGDAFWFMDTVAEVEEKWPEYIAQEPDVVKVYVMYASSGREEGRECGYGLCPEVLREVVKRAHAAGKRVFAHVNTAADVRLALDAGVDALAHLPSGNDGITVDESEFWLDAETIQRAGEWGMTVIPTALLLVEDLATFRADTLQQEIARQRTQLRRLHEAGARIALSGHNWGVTARREAMYFHAYDFFDNRTLLQLLTETTPQAIFPKRKIGRLEKGYEASFLVLGGNPLEQFDAVRDIRLRVKEGCRLANGER